MVLGQKRHAVGRFAKRQDAEQALSQLKSAGFSVEQVSLVAKYTDIEQVAPDKSNSYEVEHKEAAGAIAGGMLGAVVGCLIGLGMLVIPGITTVLAVKTAATAVASTLTGSGIGIAGGGLISVLASLDLPHRSKVERDRRLPGEYLLIVDGSDEEVLRAESILSKSCSTKVWIY